MRIRALNNSNMDTNHPKDIIFLFHIRLKVRRSIEFHIDKSLPYLTRTLSFIEISRLTLTEHSLALRVELMLQELETHVAPQ